MHIFQDNENFLKWQPKYEVHLRPSLIRTVALPHGRDYCITITDALAASTTDSKSTTLPAQLLRLSCKSEAQQDQWFRALFRGVNNSTM
jgi:hypothetical protein